MIHRNGKQRPQISDTAMLPRAERFTAWLRDTLDRKVRIRGPWRGFTHYPPYIVGKRYNVYAGEDHIGNYVIADPKKYFWPERLYAGLIPGYERRYTGRRITVPTCNGPVEIVEDELRMIPQFHRGQISTTYGLALLLPLDVLPKDQRGPLPKNPFLDEWLPDSNPMRYQISFIVDAVRNKSYVGFSLRTIRVDYVVLHSIAGQRQDPNTDIPF